MEADHARPVELFTGHEAGEELVLTGCSRENDVGVPRGLLTISDRLAHSKRGCPSCLGSVVVDLHLEGID